MQSLHTLSREQILERIEPAPERSTLLEKMRSSMNQTHPGAIGLQLDAIQEDRAEGSVYLGMNSANGQGFVHGGVLFSLGDSISACLLFKLLGDIPEAVTVSAGIRYLRPVDRGRVRCEARLLRHEGREYRFVTNFTNEDGKRVARAKFDYLILASGDES